MGGGLGDDDASGSDMADANALQQTLHPKVLMDRCVRLELLLSEFQ